MIEVNNLNIENLLFDFNLKIESGQKIRIKGKNGSGKTTLSKIIAGIPQAFKYTGTIKRNGHKILLVPDSSVEMFDTLKVSQVYSILGIKSPQNKEIISLLGINAFIDTEMKKLSLGQRKKVNLSIAFVLDWDLIILDEPFSGLDKKSKNIIENLISELKTYIIISHENFTKEGEKIRTVNLDEYKKH